MSYYQYFDHYRKQVYLGNIPTYYPLASSYCENIYYNQTPYIDPSVALGFTTRNLVYNDNSLVNCQCNYPNPILASGINLIYDNNLICPWSILIINDVIYVTNSEAGTISRYNLLGNPILSNINVFGSSHQVAQPTGIVFNADVDAFYIRCGSSVEASKIITVTLGGTINGYNEQVNCIDSIVLYDGSKCNDVYTGVEIVNFSGKNPKYNSYVDSLLYVTDFYNKKISVFNKKMKLIDLPFIDEYNHDPIPEDYSPYNIVAVGDYLYVMYAKQDPTDNQYPLYGLGNGYISIFDFDGIFVKRFVSRCSLNIPWGLLLSPPCFRYPAGSIMVSNYGDNNIIVYDENGNCLGSMRDNCQNPLILNGIRGFTVNKKFSKSIYWVGNNNNSSVIGNIAMRRLD